MTKIMFDTNAFDRLLSKGVSWSEVEEHSKDKYDVKVSHLALARIELDLDDGVKVNYEKVQTAWNGKKYSVPAKI